MRGLVRSAEKRQSRAVGPATIVIEEMYAGQRPDVIELAAADELAARAIAMVADSDLVRFERRAFNGPCEGGGRPAAMLVAIVDGRSDGEASLTDLLALARPGALGIAIVAVTSALPARSMSVLAPRFEAVLPVVVGGEGDAEAALARAIAMLTAFATGDCISMPVDEIYPFFVGAGVLSSGRGEGSDVGAALESALAAAGLDEGADVTGRMLLHIETTQADLPGDLLVVAKALRRLLPFETFYPTASLTGGARKAVSVVSAQTMRA